MNVEALATDYDGTLAHHGEVAESTVVALKLFKAAGGKVILVTGRELPDLQKVFPGLGVFDRVVAENGGLLYWPATGQTQALAEPPPAEFLERLRQRGVTPLSVGQVIVATLDPFYGAVTEEINRLKLPYHISLNKGALMVLPDGVNKAEGLCTILEELGLSTANVAGVGDAENDLSFLKICGISAAVGNALEHLKQQVHLVLKGRQGEGVEELIETLLVQKRQTPVQPAHRG